MRQESQAVLSGPIASCRLLKKVDLETGEMYCPQLLIRMEHKLIPGNSGSKASIPPTQPLIFSHFPVTLHGLLHTLLSSKDYSSFNQLPLQCN